MTLVLILGGVVATVSNGTSIWVPPRPGWVNREALILRIAGILAVGMAVAGAWVYARHRMVLLRRPDPPPLSRTLLRAVPVTTVAVAMIGLLVIARTPPTRKPPSDPQATEGSVEGIPLQFRGSLGAALRAGQGGGEEQGTDPDATDRTLILLVLFGAVLATGLVTGWWLTRRSGSPQGEAEMALDPQRAAAHHAVVGTIDAMLADPDPRTAIIGAYARLLEGLAACGTARRHYEGPVEHLRRVLTVLRVPPAPLHQLIDLFEVARFSRHLLTPAHRTQALDALRAVAESLGGPSAPFATSTAVPSSMGSHT